MDSIVEIMARRFLDGKHITVGLSVFLFIFMFLPTFVILLAVVVFFGLIYPGLRKSHTVDREHGMEPLPMEIKH